MSKRLNDNKTFWYYDGKGIAQGDPFFPILFNMITAKIVCDSTYLTLAAPKPPIISMNSEPFIDRKGTLASVATALASKVLPQPGGPSSRAPFGTWRKKIVAMIAVDVGTPDYHVSGVSSL